MTNIIISGANGKMGKVIASLCKNDPTVNVVCGFDVNTEPNGLFEIYSNYALFAGKADVVIDFSHPANLEKVVEFCERTNTALVMATTGLTDDQKDKVLNLSKKVPVFFSANMSLGVNLLVNLAKKATEILEDSFDIEIIEKHHNQKIDAPSGTAYMIADAIKDTMKNSAEYVYDRQSKREKRKEGEIGISSIRGGTIVGEHTVIFAGNDEIIELKHTATSKNVFAIGSVKAAKFLKDKDAGLYDMKDILN